jgi:nicotinate-nucleotide adenylyltransferase
VWLVVSPQNPFKTKETLLNEYDRLHLINLAIEGNNKLRASDIEFKLPKPSYTIDTLTYLKEKYPEHSFSLLMGSDNLASLHKWKNYEQILKNYPIYLYKRRGSSDVKFPEGANIQVVDFPFLDISATFIRQCIKAGYSMQYFMPEKVWNYIEEMRFFRKT